MKFPDDPGAMRLARYMSNAGIASRRRCEELIAEGRVTVNGECVTTPLCVVVPGKDRILFEGRELRLGEMQYIMLNKPVGYLCSSRDPHAKRLIYDLLPASMKSLFYVGRLDRDTEGLLILTNDGDLSQGLTHPSREVPKRYIADCDGSFTDAMAHRMTDGIEDEGEMLCARSVRLKRQLDGHCLLELVLTEGKKREVRRLCAACGLDVVRLTRVAVGNLELGGLPSSEWRNLTPDELNSLRAIIGEPVEQRNKDA